MVYFLTAIVPMNRFYVQILHVHTSHEYLLQEHDIPWSQDMISCDDDVYTHHIHFIDNYYIGTLSVLMLRLTSAGVKKSWDLPLLRVSRAAFFCIVVYTSTHTLGSSVVFNPSINAFTLNAVHLPSLSALSSVCLFRMAVNVCQYHHHNSKENFNSPNNSSFIFSASISPWIFLNLTSFSLSCFCNLESLLVVSWIISCNILCVVGSVMMLWNEWNLLMLNCYLCKW